MTWRTSLWLAVRGGRSDRLRIVLTAGATALATVFLLLAAAVVAPRTDRSWYSVLGLWDDPGMVPGVAFALVLLCLPPLALAVQCGRVGAPARDRRGSRTSPGWVRPPATGGGSRRWRPGSHRPPGSCSGPSRTPSWPWSSTCWGRPSRGTARARS